MRRYIPYIYMILLSTCLWFIDTTYMEIVLIGMSTPCLALMYQLKGKAKITKPLIITGVVTMCFATGAQLLGYNKFGIWSIPEQHLIMGRGRWFPFEEWLYWFIGMCLPILIYKHLEVYYESLVSRSYFWFCRILDRQLTFPYIFISIQITRTFVALLLTSLIYWLFMINIEARCIILECFRYDYSKLLGGRIFGVPYEGFFIYPLVAFFTYYVYRITGGK